ncbi:MAG: DUF1345 domain-containing protein [Blastocatellia bacterium]
MNELPLASDEPLEREPRWPAFVAMLAVGGVYAALPTSLTVGPRWLYWAVVSVLLIPTIISHHTRQHDINKIFSIATISAVTIEVIISVILLLRALIIHAEKPSDLLLSAGSLWLTNVLVFALWYWRLDAGGPNHRDLRTEHTTGAFLFPQMTMENAEGWSPTFVDYLFLAFNTSTAFSPTDVPVLARWAKLLMMLQSFISLTVVALLAARAVNVL